MTINTKNRNSYIIAFRNRKGKISLLPGRYHDYREANARIMDIADAQKFIGATNVYHRKGNSIALFSNKNDYIECWRESIN